MSLSERDARWAQAVNEDALRPEGERRGIVRVLQEQADAETADLKAELKSARQRLERIARAHEKNVGDGGLTSGDCIECGESDPCPTRIWATTNRNPLAVWDPATEDGEELEELPFDQLMAESSVGRIPDSAVAEAVDTYRQLRGQQLTPEQEQLMAEAVKVLRAVAAQVGS